MVNTLPAEPPEIVVASDPAPRMVSGSPPVAAVAGMVTLSRKVPGPTTMVSPGPETETA